jgi:hypothetical protein
MNTGALGNPYIPYNDGEKVRVMFVFQDPFLWPAWEGLYGTLTRDGRFSVKMLQTEKADFAYETQTASSRGANISPEPYSEEAIAAFAPHFAFLQTPYDYIGRPVSAYSLRLKNKGVRVAYVPYGIEIADTPMARYDHFRTPVIENAYRIYVLSEAFAGEYKKYCNNYAAVRPLGLPRFDKLLQRKHFKLPREILDRVNGRPIVVWHAHFAKTSFLEKADRQITPYLEEYMEFAKHLSAFEQYFFIFLPHPKFGNDAADEISNQKSKKVVAFIEMNENAYIDRSEDYRPSLLSANAVITDRSSLMVEAAVCNAPVLYLSNPDYRENIFPPLKPLIDSYAQGTGCPDMLAFMHSLENGQDGRRQAREAAFLESIPCMDGNCAKRIAEDLYSSIRDESAASGEPKPQNKLKIILFGAGFLYRTVVAHDRFPDYCEIAACADNDSGKWGRTADGFKIIRPEEIPGMDFDKVIIMVNSLQAEHVYKQLRFDLEIPERKIEYCEYLATL